jgi:hypothetical protein
VYEKSWASMPSGRRSEVSDSFSKSSVERVLLLLFGRSRLRNETPLVLCTGAYVSETILRIHFQIRAPTEYEFLSA